MNDFNSSKLGFIDIETIPRDTMEDLGDIEITPPKTMKKKETIDAWLKENVDKEKEKILRAQALVPNLARPVTICISVESKELFDINKPNVMAFTGHNEYEILKGLEDYLKSELIITYKEGDEERFYQAPLTWVGFNIRNFDLEVIWFRAIYYELYFLAKLISRKRFSDNCLDLMELAVGPNNQRKISYDNLMKSLELGEKTKGMDGSKVYDHYLDGELFTVIEPYCVDDTLGNRKLYDKIVKGLSL